MNIHEKSFKAIVSNGFGQFHLAHLAEEWAKQGTLEFMLTGGYPHRRRQLQGAMAQKSGILRRLSEREANIAPELVRACWSAEIPHQASQTLYSRNAVRAADELSSRAFLRYQAWASKQLDRPNNGTVYHYRAGLGGRSQEKARAQGLATICDHSIVHPLYLGQLSGDPTLAERGFWRHVMRDLEEAQAVLVNSEFVRESCMSFGMDGARIFVAHTPVDANFLALLDGAAGARSSVPSIIFAGTVERRKGADDFLEAADLVGPSDSATWRLIGDWMPDMQVLREKLPSHVLCEGKLPRRELAARLSQTSVFVFPSRAEGSARVVAEALAAGCYVITTKEAGSVVRPMVDGDIIPSNNPTALGEAIERYLSLPSSDRESRAASTAKYARTRLSQHRYAEDVARAYEQAGAVS